MQNQQDPGYELSVVIERELASFYRPCLVQAGYGGSISPLSPPSSSFLIPSIFFSLLPDLSLSFCLSLFFSFSHLDLFQGVKCSIDVDCENLDTTCDVSAGKCRPGASQVRRDMFFDCFMENMPPKVEVNFNIFR